MKNEFPDLIAHLDIKDLLAYFQPIYSLRDSRVIGVEALLRPVGPGDAFLAPALLFEHADNIGLLLDLERAARYVALRRYAATPPDNRPILFLNFSAKLLDSGSLDPGLIVRSARDFGVEPGSVALEIVESAVRSQHELTEFARRNRESGFLITLDDFGSSHSNLDRVTLVRPDIIKVDRSIIAGVATSHMQQSVLRSIVHLARSIGALTLAEGLEHYEDLVSCVRAGVDLGQGFLLGRPAEDPCAHVGRVDTPAAKALAQVTAELRSDAHTSNAQIARIESDTAALIAALETTPTTKLGEILAAELPKTSLCECGYIIDDSGEQISDTVPGEAGGVHSGAVRHPLFRPASCGTDHSRKDYVYTLLALGNERFLTDPYVSLATGRMCRTLARRFRDADGAPHILCVDIAG